MKITMHLDLEIERRQLAQRLAHQARLHAGLHVAHLAFELGLGGQGRHRVDHQHVDGARAHQRVGDLQRLLAVIGLGDQQVGDLDAELAGIDRVERVLGVDEGADAALLLGFRQHLQGQRGLAGGFRAVNLDHPAARQAADAERDIQPQGARGNGLDLDALVVGTEPHDRALAEVLVDLVERGLQRLLLVHASPFDHPQRRLFHARIPLFHELHRQAKRDSALTTTYTFCSLRTRTRAPARLREHRDCGKVVTVTEGNRCASCRKRLG